MQCSTPDPSLTAICEKTIGLLSGIQTLLLEIGGGVVILALVFAGFKYMTGDPKNGKTGIVAAVVGTAIVLLSYTIIGLVITSFSS